MLGLPRLQRAASWQRGVERGLDATTTRTLMGNAYPQPGLYGKFFDADMDPLVEVVRDTVGRHDTFALACTAKYYEDLGYPGHVNCTENFNGQLDPLRDRRRAAAGRRSTSSTTPASTTTNSSLSDEPWSRPGDYVLLRAPDRPGLRLLGMPRRHRPRQRLGDHRRPRPRLPAGEPLLDGDRPSRHPGGRTRCSPRKPRSIRAPRL